MNARVPGESERDLPSWMTPMSKRLASIPILLSVVGAILSGCGGSHATTAGNSANGEKPASTAAAPIERRQFDLACTGSRQFDETAASGPNPRPYRPPVTRNESSRIVVDLDRKVYCYSRGCELGSTSPIAEEGAERLVLYRDEDLEQSISWRTGAFEGRYRYGDRVSVQQGICRFEPFSGFRPRRVRLIPVRDREGTEPHPFIEYDRTAPPATSTP